MKKHKLKHPVEMMSKILDVSTSDYYNLLKSGPSDRWLENRAIIELIDDVFEKVIKVIVPQGGTVELEKRGYKVSRSRPRTALKMKALGAEARKTRKFKNTTDV